MQKGPGSFVVTLSALLLWETALRASPEFSSLDHVIDSLQAVREFDQVAISPDGTRVAWVESLHGPNGKPTPQWAIYVQEVRTPGRPQRITAGNGGAAYAERGIAWSPDSRQLAFLSDKSVAQLQLYVADLAGVHQWLRRIRKIRRRDRQLSGEVGDQPDPRLGI